MRGFGAFLQDSKIKVQSHCIARALLFDLLSQLYPEKAEEGSERTAVATNRTHNLYSDGQRPSDVHPILSPKCYNRSEGTDKGLP